MQKIEALPILACSRKEARLAEWKQQGGGPREGYGGGNTSVHVVLWATMRRLDFITI